jgi:DUF2993 family protein
MPRHRHLSPRRLLLWVAGAVLLVLVLSQLLLPRIAASRIHSRLSRYGEVHSVDVSAWPALELLLGDADSVHIHAGALAMSTARAATLLHEAKGISSLSVSATSVHLGRLRLTHAGLQKHGDRLSATGVLSAGDARAALPPGVTAQLLSSQHGKVEVRVSGSLFGIGATLAAVGEASDGRIVVRPAGLLLGAVGLTIYSDPRIYVLGVSAQPAPAEPGSYTLGLTALLR